MQLNNQINDTMIFYVHFSINKKHVIVFYFNDFVCLLMIAYFCDCSVVYCSVVRGKTLISLLDISHFIRARMDL